MGNPTDIARRVWCLGLIVGGFLTAVIAGLWIRSPLGHDESVYALRARDILDHGWSTTTGDYWRDYRAPGVPMVVAAIGKMIGIHVTTSRALVAICGAIVIGLTWWIVRRTANRPAADLSAGLLAATSGFVMTSSVLLADTPGAALSLAAIALYLRDVQSGRLRWSMAVVPLLAFMATTMRFGAPITLGAGLVGVSLIELPAVVKARNWVLAMQGLLLALAVGLACALVVMTDFVSLDGQSPTQANRDLLESNGLTPASGLRDLWSVVIPVSGGPEHMWSTAVAMLFTIGVGLALVGGICNRVPRSTVTGLAVAGTISLAGVALGVGQVVPNYLVLTLPFWAGLAGIGLAWPTRATLARANRRAARAAMLALMVLAASVLVIDAGRELRATHHTYVRAFGNVRAASTDMRSMWGETCILITSYTPQVGYYSRCIVVPLGDLQDTADPSSASLGGWLRDQISSVEADTTARVAIVLRERGKRQPPDEVVGMLDRISAPVLQYGAANGESRVVWVYPIQQCVLWSTC